MSDGRSVHANILAGPDVQIVEMSRRDLLLESDVRLTPGAGICLNVTIDDANYLAGGRISKVDATLSGGQVKYRAGVTLDNDMPAFEPVSKETRIEASSPPDGDGEEQPMDAAQQQQLLKTALRSAEAARRELAEELQTERAKWEELRKSLEHRVAAAEQKVDAAARQVNAGKDAAKLSEQALAQKHAKEQAEWQTERAALQEAARRAEALAKQQADASSREFDAKLREAEGRIKTAESRAKDGEARVALLEKSEKELERRQKELEKRREELEGALRAADGKTKDALARAEQLAKDLAAADQRATAADARGSHLAGELAASREAEQQLQTKLKDEEAKLLDLVQENERQIEEIEGIRALLANAEQMAARHEQEKQSWQTQKERLAARLQLTEKWCADQQDLLYSLRQHITGASTLLDGWKPVAADGAEADAKAGAKNGKKATA